MKEDTRSTLEYVVEQLNKPEALAKFRSEIVGGRAIALALRDERKERRQRRKLAEQARHRQIDELEREANFTSEERQKEMIDWQEFRAERIAFHRAALQGAYAKKLHDMGKGQPALVEKKPRRDKS